jgi:hypothetical protein
MHTARSHTVKSLRAAALAALLSALLTACASAASPAADSSASASGAMGTMSGMGGAPEPMYTGDGLSASAGGFSLVTSGNVTAFPAGRPLSIPFRIEDSMGMPVTSFQFDQARLMHFYVVRSDLTGFQHVHPTMASDGTWTAHLASARPGTYRAYASFATKNSGGKALALVLSKQFTVTGSAVPTSLPAAAATAEVDGYTVTLAGDLMAGMEHTLTATITKNGVPVTDLQPYLDTYAHLTAFHEGDMAFAHLHPKGTVDGDHGGPKLSFDAAMAESGNYRLFLQFQTDGALHTAALTVRVG